MAVAQTSRSSGEKDSFLDRPAASLITLNRETLLYAGIVLLAAILRFWDLGSRMLHHDESIHAVYSWYLLTGRGYVHNPTYHGALLYHATALMYFLFGATDYAVRMAPAIFGTAMVAMPYLLRRQLGRTGALVSSLLLALSPVVLYYSRSLRHDVFAATGTLALVIALWRYRDDRQPRWLYLAVGGLVVGYTTHELTFMTVFILVLFTVATSWRSLLDALRHRDRGRLSPFGEYLLLIATLAAPQFTAAVLIIQRFVDPRAPVPPVGQLTPLLLLTFAVIVWLSTTIGLWWNRRVWLYGALLFYSVFIVLYTAFLSNPDGFFTSTIGSLQYWLSQQEVKRGDQPWFYYLIIVPLYEFVPLVFGIGGMVYAFAKRHFFGFFLAYWACISFVLFSWAGEKMPWLAMHITIPFILLAGLAIGKLLDGVDWRAVWSRGGGMLALWSLLGIIVLASLWNRGSPFSPAATPLVGQQQLYQWLALAALFVILAFAALRAARHAGHARQVVSLLVLAIMMIFSVRATWEVNYHNGDTPVEMMVYTQSSPDVGKVMREIERVAFRTGAGYDLKVAYDDGVSWPFEWYLKDYKGKQYFGNGSPAVDAPIVLVGFENDHDSRVRTQLANNYVGQRYKLRWWFPEDYRGITPGSIRWALFDPVTRGKLWRYFLYRETLNPLGSTDFMMYERKDLVGAVASLTTPGAASLPEDDVLAKQARSLAPIQAWGVPGNGPGQFSEPKNLALGPDGSVYVLDTKNNRVQKFDSVGRLLVTWGNAGQADGQFAEPWGIAVGNDGSVYVADTWNHRLQKFDAGGNFLLKWGQFGSEGNATSSSFYGPRGVAVDAFGNVYVTDTGNHRLLKFDKDGQYQAAVGTRGAADGQFNEPVGVSVDASGRVYVADTWNHRVQQLDSALRPLGQWPVPVWQGESPTNKPYLAADAAGNVYLSDPDNNRLLKLGPTGAIAAVWGQFGAADSVRLPTGIAVDAAGNVLVADSSGNRVLKFGPVR